MSPGVGGSDRDGKTQSTEVAGSGRGSVQLECVRDQIKISVQINRQINLLLINILISEMFCSLTREKNTVQISY